MVDIDRYNEIRSLLVTASAAAGCSPVLRLSGVDGPVPSWAGAPVRVLGMADAGRSVWLARVEHDGASWVFSGPSFAVGCSGIGGVGIVDDPDGVLPVAGNRAVIGSYVGGRSVSGHVVRFSGSGIYVHDDRSHIDRYVEDWAVNPIRSAVTVGAVVDVELSSGDHYRASVVDTHVDQGAQLKPCACCNGGGAAPDADQLATRLVPWGDIVTASHVFDGWCRACDPDGDHDRTGHDDDAPDIMDVYPALERLAGAGITIDPANADPAALTTLSDDIDAVRAHVVSGYGDPGIDPRDRFAVALDDFKRSARVLRGAWEHLPGDILGNTYPAGWDDFAEVFAEIDRMSMFGNVDPPPTVPTAPRVPVEGERVVWVVTDDSRMHLGVVIPAGTTGTIATNHGDGIEIRPDDPAIRERLADWDGCVVYTVEDGHGDALGMFGDDADALTQAWTLADVAALAAWRNVAPLGDRS